MKRWWIIPALAGVLVIGGLAYLSNDFRQENRQIVRNLNNDNQRAFFEMVGEVQNVEAMLSKGIVSNSSRQRMMIFADVWQQAFAAQENLSRIPIAGPSATRTSTFLAQTGDFAWSLAKGLARGEAIKQEDVKKLNELHTEAGFLAAELQKIQTSAEDGILTWGEIRQKSNQNLKQAANVPDGLMNVDKNMEDYPTLIYDGPYSDHIMTRKPLGLSGQVIDRERAAALAKNFVEAGDNRQYRVRNIDNVNGTIPAFRVYLTPQNGDSPSVAVDLAKKGGHPLMMVNSRDVNRASITGGQVVDVASKFLVSRNLTNMEPTYQIQQQNTGIVIFEYKQDGVIIYPDLMKVKVALDTGEVVGFEGFGYFMNHHDRKLPKAKISETKAQAAVNPQLKITSKRLVVIPLETLEEVLAYEFRGDINGDTFIVYINAETGEEERILKVIDTKSGPVTL